MAKIRLSLKNLIDTATLSGGSWSVAAPLANFQQDYLSKVTRSVDALTTSTRIDIDLGTAKPVFRHVAFAKHNLSTAATVTILCSDVGFGNSELHNSGAQAAWPVVYQPEDLEWEDDNWWEGTITAAEAEGYPMPFEYDCGANIRARYVRIQITDTGNTDGYVELAGAWLGPIWSPTRNVSFGASLSWENRTQADYSLGGSVFTDYRPPARVYQFTLNRLTDAEAYGVILDAQRRVGTDQRLWVIPNWDDVARRFKRDFMCRIRRYDPVAQANNKLHDTTFVLEEWL